VGFLDRFRRSKKRGVRRQVTPDRGPKHTTREIQYARPQPARPEPRRYEGPPPRSSSPAPPAPAPAARTEIRPAVPAPGSSTQAVPTPRVYPEPTGYSAESEIDGATVVTDVRGVFSHVVGVLVVVDGDCEGQVYKLKDGENKIGRTADCDVQIASRHISRPHAMLIHREGMFAVRPLSANGATFVNDQRIEDMTQIADREHIKFGRTTVRLLSVA